MPRCRCNLRYPSIYARSHHQNFESNCHRHNPSGDKLPLCLCYRPRHRRRQCPIRHHGKPPDDNNHLIGTQQVEFDLQQVQNRHRRCPCSQRCKCSRSSQCLQQASSSTSDRQCTMLERLVLSRSRTCPRRSPCNQQILQHLCTCPCHTLRMQSCRRSRRCPCSLCCKCRRSSQGSLEATSSRSDRKRTKLFLPFQLFVPDQSRTCPRRSSCNQQAQFQF